MTGSSPAPLFAISEGNLLLTLTDTDDQSCIRSNVVVTAPEMCSYEVYNVAPSASYDFGDAPDVYGTDLADNGGNVGVGARHVIDPRLKIGWVVDSEVDGNPAVMGTDAVGDNNNGSNDEDGVTIPDLVEGNPVALNVYVTNATSSNAYLVCWIDYNQDGQFDTGNNDAGTPTEAGMSVVMSNTGTAQNIRVEMPPVPEGSGGVTYARCRLSTDVIDQNNPTGFLSDGEVEDYKVAILGNVVPDTSQKYQVILLKM